MFKRLFGGAEPDRQGLEEVPVSSLSPNAKASPLRKSVMAERGEFTLNPEPVIKKEAEKRPLRTFRRLRDMLQQLPASMINRVREIDSILGSTCAETHRLLVVMLTELMSQNEDNAIFVPDSEEWDAWYRAVTTRCVDFRRGIKEKTLELIGRLDFPKRDAGRLNAIVEARPGELEALTGMDKLEDIKSNLFDVALLLGPQKEQSIIQSVLDEPIRVSSS